MMLTRLLFCTFFIASYTQLAGAQTSTAGVPLSQNVGNGATSTAIPSGLGGQSTGVIVSFQPGATAPPPSSSVNSGPSLTGAALSEQQSSLSDASNRGLGSNGMYTSTTGGAISGISTGIPGGYNEPTPFTTASTTSTTEGQSATDSAGFSSSTTPLLWGLSTVAFLMGALIVL